MIAASIVVRLFNLVISMAILGIGLIIHRRVDHEVRVLLEPALLAGFRCSSIMNSVRNIANT